jgi:predicted dithiol-disulfide oxidoreductase (DUF899 family)
MARSERSGKKAHRVVSRKAWLTARTALLKKEKAFTRQRDQLSRQRRALPWVKIDKPYAFDGPNGRETLAQLFEQRSQLVIYHFMFDPTDDAGCSSCSFWADHYDGMGVHLNHRDVTFAAVSRAPFAKIEAFKRRMGWRFKWVSSSPSDFNYDFHVSFTPESLADETASYNFGTIDPEMPDREGASVFCKDSQGNVFHTYSTYARGIDMLNGTYQFLDLVPKGRDEAPGAAQQWVRYHDRYTG